MPPASDLSSVAILILIVIFIAVTVGVLTHLLGPHRTGPVKDSVYESGMDPFSDSRKRFNVRFYLVAVMFLVFDVEVIFLYPFAVTWPKMMQGGSAEATALTEAAAGYGASPLFILTGAGLFFVLLTVGFLYEWQKGIFKWD